MKQARFFVLLMLLVSIATPTAAFSGENVRIGRMALVLCHSPALLLDRMEFLEKNGINNYELKDFTKGSQAALALGAGEIDVAFFGAIIPAIANGLDARIVAVNSKGGVQVVSKDPSVKSLEGLKGKRVGNIGPTAAPTTILSLALSDVGLSSKEVEYVSINRRNIVIAMMEKSVVDTAVLVEPLTSEAVKRGARVILDEKALYNGGDYPFTFLVARKEFIEKNPETLRKIIKAHQDSQNYLEENTSSALKIVGKYFENSGVSISDSDLADAMATNIFQSSISKRVMSTLVKVMAESDIIGPKSNINDFIDCSFGTCVD